MPNPLHAQITAAARQAVADYPPHPENSPATVEAFGKRLASRYRRLPDPFTVFRSSQGTRPNARQQTGFLWYTQQRQGSPAFNRGNNPALDQWQITGLCAKTAVDWEQTLAHNIRQPRLYQVILRQTPQQIKIRPWHSLASIKHSVDALLARHPALSQTTSFNNPAITAMCDSNPRTFQQLLSRIPEVIVPFSLERITAAQQLQLCKNHPWVALRHLWPKLTGRQQKTLATKHPEATLLLAFRHLNDPALHTLLAASTKLQRFFVKEQPTHELAKRLFALKPQLSRTLLVAIHDKLAETI